jgi:hypothetical protein
MTDHSRLRNVQKGLLTGIVLIMLWPNHAMAQFAGFSITSPTDHSAVPTADSVTVTWTGGDPAKQVNIVLIDMVANQVWAGFGLFPNTGSAIVTLPPSSQLKCAHDYRFYIEDFPRTQWAYGPLVVMVCADQTVFDTVKATAFVGDGSGLTGVSKITGVTPLSGLTGGGSTGNVFLSVDSTVARTNTSNVFSVDQTVNGALTVSSNLSSGGSLTIGGGTRITQHLSATTSITVPALKVGACSETSLALSGVSDGDTVALGVPNALMQASGIPSYTAWVGAADLIKIRACNLDPNIPQKTGVTGVIRVDVWKH